MDNNEKAFPEQKAPEKNTDKAFVQVGKDGQPVMPAVNEKGEKKDAADPITEADPTIY